MPQANTLNAPVPRHQHPAAEDIEDALLAAARSYFDDCRQRIPGFIDRHFNYPGAWHTNKVALGLDILRAPLNLLWAPIYAGACLLKFFIRKSRRQRLYRFLDRIPAGLDTRVQQHVSELIYTELLQTSEQASALEDYVLAALQQSYSGQYPAAPGDQAHLRQQLEPLIEDAMLQYQVTRTASADITNTFACTVLGAFAFQKFTPGGIGVGLLLASILAKTIAARDFIFGSFLGGLYYAAFPPTPSLATTFSSVLIVLLGLAAFASLSGLLADPIQAATGLHRRRLNRLIDHLEDDFRRKTRGGFRPKDQFVARVLDMFDMVKSNLG
ncbi:MAG: hypothetical protein GYB33_22255 [Gammaproteobacteria bacterium]|nr:hypothetical protein [Gammaproteobacteria bacterium]